MIFKVIIIKLGTLIVLIYEFVIYFNKYIHDNDNNKKLNI